MKINNFFKILNKKIEWYNKKAINPFTYPHPFAIIWIEESEDYTSSKYKNNKFY